jgi:hypothetical protein
MVLMALLELTATVAAVVAELAVMMVAVVEDLVRVDLADLVDLVRVEPDEEHMEEAVLFLSLFCQVEPED